MEYALRGEQFRKTKINSVGLSWKYKTQIGGLEIFQWEVQLLFSSLCHLQHA